MMYCRPKPVMCEPRRVVRDHYIPRVVPFVHPVEIVHRYHIVNVPRHVYRPYVRREVVDPGYPDRCNCDKCRH